MFSWQGDYSREVRRALLVAFWNGRDHAAVVRPALRPWKKVDGREIDGGKPSSISMLLAVGADAASVS